MNVYCQKFAPDVFVPQKEDFGTVPCHKMSLKGRVIADY